MLISGLRIRRSFLIHFVSYTFLFAFIRCQNKTTIESTDDEWMFLSMGFGKENITIVSHSDTLYWNIIDTTEIKRLDSLTIPFSTISRKVVITKTEKDSLKNWLDKLLLHPHKPQQFCTDYFGRLTVKKTINNQVSQKSNYMSVCDWKTIGAETMKIDSLMKEKFAREGWK